MSKARSRVFIVDDDEGFSKSLARLVRSIGYDVEVFSSARAFLERKGYKGISCLLLDVRMPGLTGPDLQQELSRRNIPMPIIFLTAHGDIPTGVKAIKDGAVDFLTKPVEEQSLFQAIDQALDKDVQLKKQHDIQKKAQDLINSLTPREHEVLRWIITGMLNKQIAYFLNISERTIKAHRAEIMRKLNVVSVAELVRLAATVGLSPARTSPMV